MPKVPIYDVAEVTIDVGRGQLRVTYDQNKLTPRLINDVINGASGTIPVGQVFDRLAGLVHKAEALVDDAVVLLPRGIGMQFVMMFFPELARAMLEGGIAPEDYTSLRAFLSSHQRKREQQTCQ